MLQEDEQPHQPPQRAPRQVEWATIRAFRGLIRFYTKCSYLLSNPYPQVIFTGESIISLIILAYYFLFASTVGLNHIFAYIGVVFSVSQIYMQSSGLYKYFNKEQPGPWLVAGFIFSCIGTIAISITSVTSMWYHHDTEPGNALATIFFLNTVMLYYTLWQFACLVLLLFFVLELALRAVTSTLTSPVNSNIMLPLLFYPRIPNQALLRAGQAEVLKYSKAEHAQVTECILCLVEFVEGDKITVLECHRTHLFHADCLKQWKLKSDTCPMCRTKIIEMPVVGGPKS